MDLTGNHLRAARALVGLAQEGLSERSGVSINTIRNMEACADQPIGGFASTRDKVQRALEGLGIEFTNGTSPGVRLMRRSGEGASASKGAAGARASARSKPSRRPFGGRQKR
jgi:transcriptional regulator with XRE-family HTH domain